MGTVSNWQKRCFMSLREGMILFEGQRTAGWNRDPHRGSTSQGRGGSGPLWERMENWTQEERRLAFYGLSRKHPLTPVQLGLWRRCLPAWILGEHLRIESGILPSKATFQAVVNGRLFPEDECPTTTTTTGS